MTKKLGITVLLLSVLVLTAAPAFAIDWDNGGGDTAWSTAGNWDPDGYATSDDLIVLSGAPTANAVVVTDNGGSITLNGPTASTRNRAARAQDSASGS